MENTEQPPTRPSVYNGTHKPGSLHDSGLEIFQLHFSLLLFLMTVGQPNTAVLCLFL